MHTRSFRRIARFALTGALLGALQACAPASPSASVADAYVASGAIAIPPYTRTIFSSNNF